MGAAFRIYRHRVPQGVDWEPLDRVNGRDGSQLVESDVTSIEIEVFQADSGTAILSQTGLSPSAGVDTGNRVFDTLQTDDRWTIDAEGYNSRQLILLTDVPGVMDGSGKLLARLSPDDARALIVSGVVAGGMVPKVEACLCALSTVTQTQIVDGREPHILVEVIAGKGRGTIIA